MKQLDRDHVRVTCLGGPQDGRELKICLRTRFIDFPTKVGQLYGRHRYLFIRLGNGNNVLSYEGFQW